MNLKRITFAILAILLLSTISHGAPKADLWAKWKTFKAGDEKVVDHSPWDRFLARYLVPDAATGANLVRYSAVTGGDKKELDQYIKALESTKVLSLSRQEQLPYWINLYNALTVKVILDRYPVKSIKDIDLGGAWFTSGPWDAKLLKIEGEEVSLNDIEHRILRPIFKDNRIHYALNCASIGCPNLRKVAYTSKNTPELLEKGAREYVNNPRGAHFDGAKLVASGIYGWYREDFGDSVEGVVKHLSKYADEKLARRLYGYNLRIRYEYDWNLNEAK